jgi:hypothetical protein
MGGLALESEKRELLMKLAAQIATEQDPKKFQDLLVELNKLLEEKERRLAQPRKSPDPAPSK